MKKWRVVAAAAAWIAAAAWAQGNEAAKWDPAMAVRNAVVTNGVKWIDGRDLPLEGRAFGDTDHYYDRLPSGVTTNVNGGVRSMKHHTSGMLFRFVTDSRRLRIRWTPYHAGLSMDHMPATGVSGIDVYRWDAARARWVYAKTGRITDPKGASCDLAWTPGTPCIVNLPLYNGVRSFSLGIDPGAKIAPFPHRSGVEKPVVFYGTSITHGGCASRPGLGFVNLVGRDLDVPVVGLGFSGSGFMELEMSEHLARIDASCYVLDCLWNMGMKKWNGRPGRNVDENYEPFIRRLRALRPGVPIVMAERCDVWCGAPNEQDRFIRALYDKLVAEGWKNLVYLPKDRMFTGDGEGTVDGCHPNDLGMRSLADAFGGAVRAALGMAPSAGAAGPGTYFTPPEGTGNVAARAPARPDAKVCRTVAFLGGSITEMHGFRPRVMDALRARYPDVAFREIAAGLSSTCSDAGAFRLEEDVLAAGTPDLFIVEAAVNDDQDGHFDRRRCVRGLEGIVRHVRTANPACAVVVGLMVNAAQYRMLLEGETPVRGPVPDAPGGGDAGPLRGGRGGGAPLRRGARRCRLGARGVRARGRLLVEGVSRLPSLAGGLRLRRARGDGGGGARVRPASRAGGASAAAAAGRGVVLRRARASVRHREGGRGLDGVAAGLGEDSGREARVLHARRGAVERDARCGGRRAVHGGRARGLPHGRARRRRPRGLGGRRPVSEVPAEGAVRRAPLPLRAGAGGGSRPRRAHGPSARDSRRPGAGDGAGGAPPPLVRRRAVTRV